MGSCEVGIAPGLFARAALTIAHQSFLREQPFQRGEPLLVIAASIWRRGFGCDLAAEGFDPLAPFEVACAVERHHQRKGLALPRFLEVGPFGEIRQRIKKEILAVHADVPTGSR